MISLYSNFISFSSYFQLKLKKKTKIFFINPNSYESSLESIQLILHDQVNRTVRCILCRKVFNNCTPKFLLFLPVRLSFVDSVFAGVSISIASCVSLLSHMFQSLVLVRTDSLLI